MRLIIHYNRRKKTGKAAIEFQVYINRSDQPYFSSKILIEPKYCDQAGQQVKNSHPDHIIHNHTIKTFRERINEIDIIYQVKGETLTGKLLKAELMVITFAFTG